MTIKENLVTNPNPTQNETKVPVMLFDAERRQLTPGEDEAFPQVLRNQSLGHQTEVIYQGKVFSYDPTLAEKFGMPAYVLLREHS